MTAVARHYSPVEHELHRSQRARLVRDAWGAVFVVSPKGNYYRLSADRPELASIAAAWLEVTLGQLAMLLEERPS
jgi:hypothetical protein